MKLYEVRNSWAFRDFAKVPEFFWDSEHNVSIYNTDVSFENCFYPRDFLEENPLI